MKVEFAFNKERVVAVKLPQRPPADLTPEELRDLEASLVKLPLEFPATSEFRRGVWEAIRRIPFGQTLTYQQLAEQVGNPRAARAVGGACAANRLLLAVPCHRVVATRGLGGFALGLEWKRKLLALEAAAKSSTAATATAPGSQPLIKP